MLNTNVRIHCPCYQSPADNIPDQDASDTQLDLSDRRIPYSLYTLEYLYFCDDCQVHRCPRCVTEETVSIFCPQCLFEVPGRTGNTEAHCRRNCLRCPECQTGLQTFAKDDYYTLKCAFCSWDTGSLQLTGTNLVSQIMQLRGNEQKAFDRVTDYLEVLQYRANEVESEGAKLLRQYRQAIEPSTIEYAPALLGKPTEKVKLPLYTPLRSRRTKRCRQCRLLLVKPDPKPMSVNFRSRLFANRIMPTMQFTPFAQYELIPHITSQWLLKLTNPLPEVCTVSLSTKNKNHQGDQIVILCPSFELGPNSEVWEETKSKILTRSTNGDLHDIGRNYASIMLEIVAAPRNPPVVSNFAVFVQLQYAIADERGDKTSKELGYWIVLETRPSKW